MQLNLQFGFGMMEHCRTLIRDWNGGTVILSPRDLTRSQLARLSSEIHNVIGGKVLLDPQFYLPHADHDRLCNHTYWPPQYATSTFFGGDSLRVLIHELRKLNNEIQASAFIIPGLLASQISDDWLETQRLVLEEARSQETSANIYQTIALSDDAVRAPESIAKLLQFCSSDTAYGYYLVSEHPDGNYLVDDANWLANILDLCAGIKLMGAKVVLGYCNHQFLVAGLAKVDAIASGTWMNVRSFPPEKFRSATEDEVKQRATWFYCPQALSEYKVPFLDIAYRQKVLAQMRPIPGPSIDAIESLFCGLQPSTVGLSEQGAFRHYLHSLRNQAMSMEEPTFDATVDKYRLTLDAAESLLAALTRAGVRGQLRDFSDAIDVNRAAVEVLVSDRGAIMRRRWTQL